MAETVSRSLLTLARGLMRSFDFEKARATLAPFSAPDTLAVQDDDPLLFWRDAAETLRDAGMAEAAEQAWTRAGEAGMARHAAETQILAGYVLAGRAGEVLARLKELRGAHGRNAVVRNLYAITLFESGQRGQSLAEWKSCLDISAQNECPLSTHSFYLALGAMAVEGFFAAQGDKREPDNASMGTPVGAPPADPLDRAPGRRHATRMAQIDKAWEEGRYDQALRWIDAEIQEEKSSSDDLRVARALTLGGMSRWTDARREITATLQRSDVSPSAQTFLAHCLIHGGEARLALTLLERIKPAGPDDFFANYVRACAWLALGDRPRSAQAFRIAFTEYFFDSYHCVLVPAWRRMMRLLEQKSDLT